MKDIRNITLSDFKTQLQTEFKEMIDSVRTYGGFYIGRYETGNLNQTKAVVQKNNEDIGNQTWYTQYKLCKTIRSNDNVKTSMIWGCQWDATLRWMQTSTNSEVVNFPTNSEGKGNYLRKNNVYARIPTGSNSDYAVNNIYDMAGNFYEYTIETWSKDCRSLRGGDCTHKASSDPASYRIFTNPTTRSDTKGYRTTLYIK